MSVLPFLNNNKGKNPLKPHHRFFTLADIAYTYKPPSGSVSKESKNGEDQVLNTNTNTKNSKSQEDDEQYPDNEHKEQKHKTPNNINNPLSKFQWLKAHKNHNNKPQPALPPAKHVGYGYESDEEDDDHGLTRHYRILQWLDQDRGAKFYWPRHAKMLKSDITHIVLLEESVITSLKTWCNLSERLVSGDPLLYMTWWDLQMGIRGFHQVVREWLENSEGNYDYKQYYIRRVTKLYAWLLRQEHFALTQDDSLSRNNNDEDQFYSVHTRVNDNDESDKYRRSQPKRKQRPSVDELIAKQKESNLNYLPPCVLPQCIDRLPPRLKRCERKIAIVSKKLEAIDVNNNNNDDNHNNITILPEINIHHSQSKENSFSSMLKKHYRKRTSLESLRLLSTASKAHLLEDDDKVSIVGNTIVKEITNEYR